MTVTSACHVFDDRAGWHERVALRPLAAKNPARAVEITIAARPAIGRMLAASLECGAARIDLRSRGALLAGIELSRALRGSGCELLHAWGPRAAAVASRAGDTPLVVDLHDPAIAPRDVRFLRTISRSSHFAAACGSGIVRRRLIEGGVHPDLCVVIRPGVDFAFINRVKRSHLRERLGLRPAEAAVLLSPAEVPAQNLVDALLACFNRALLGQDLRVILPGATREAERLARYAAALPSVAAGRLVRTGDDVPFEELLCIADVYVLASRGDIPTVSIAWAMASRAAVIAPAVPSVAEMIAHKLNGLLFNAARSRSLVVPIARLLSDREAQTKAKEVAHGHAYEVFSAKRCTDQYAALYRNVVRGISPGEGIEDAARVAS